MRGLNRVTAAFGISILRTRSLDQLRSQPSPGPLASPAVDEGGAWLQAPDGWLEPSTSPMIVDVAWLRALTREYASHPVSSLRRLGGIWDDAFTTDIELSAFRGDTPYVWQRRTYETSNYLATISYTTARDPNGVLGVADEDGAFGAEVLLLAGVRYSRDLLDSVSEINFLLEHLPADCREPLRLVDVGAGYGRLAHRLAAVAPDCEIYCVDGVPLSTAICDAYLRYRGVGSRARVVPLTELDRVPTPIRVASNLWSFSEMSYEAVAWWLDWLVHAGVEFLFLVPNLPGFALVSDGRTYLDLLASRGFRPWVSRPKYEDPVAERYAIYPATYHLFRRS